MVSTADSTQGATAAPPMAGHRPARQSPWLVRLAWVPVPVLLAISAILYVLDLRQSHEQAELAVALNSICSLMVSMLVASMVGLSFLRRGSPGLLALGCGAVIWGLAGPTGGLLLSHGPNGAVTVHNSLVFLSASCFLAGLLLARRPGRQAGAAGLTLTAAYAGAVGLVAVVVAATVAGWMPRFFVQGRGGTHFRQVVLVLSAAMLALTGGLFYLTGRRPPTAFARWFSPALLLIAVGLIGLMLQPSVGSVLGWTGRAGQFLGGLYMLVAAVASVRETRAWEIPLEQALHQSERRYRTLFNSMTEGFALLEATPDETDPPCDFRVLDVNPAFEALTGLPRADVLDKRIREVLPGLESYWIQEYGQVALTGQSKRLESFSAELGRWYEAFAYQPAPRQVAVVFTDVSERKRTEDALREAKTRLEQKVQERTAELIEANQRLRQENEERLRTEQSLRLEEARLDALVRLGQYAEASLAEIAGFILEQGIALTRSRVGFVGFLNEDETIYTLHAVSKDVVRECGVAGDPVQWHVGGAGLWADAIRQRSTLFINDYDQPHPSKRGLPPGHPLVQRLMVVPLLDGERIVAVAGVGNKESDYDKADERQILLLLSGMWNHVLRDRSTQALRERSEQLRALASELTLAEQRERRRLAEVLHDDLQQLLVGAKLRLGLLDRSSDPAARHKAVEVQGLLDQAIERSRSLTGELSPPILSQAGLVPALEWLAVWMGQKHSLAVELEADPSAAPDSEEMTVLLFQAVRELLFNTVKHAGVRAARVSVRQVDGHIEVGVADEGAGFDPVLAVPRPGKAGGFGLFSIRERMDLLGGRIEIHSAPGRGSRFTLRAPLRGSSSPAGGQAGPPAPPTRITQRGEEKSARDAGGQPARPRIRVLLVDDHIVVRQGLSHLLRAEGDIDVVAEASDAETAIDLIGKLRPDVVTMDISLPGMDGIEATRILHAEFPEVRVIGLSMFEESARSAAMLQAGAVAYLTKSGPAGALVAAIRAAMTAAEERPASPGAAQKK